MTMRALGAHPEVLGRDLFPFETRFRQYLHAAAINGQMPPDFSPQMHHRVTYRPFLGGDEQAQEWAQQARDPALDAHALALSFYWQVAQIQGKPQPRYIIEKAVGTRLVSEFLESVPGFRALYLFRDPRDTFLSMKAFNVKMRNDRGFGAGGGDESMLKSVLSSGKIYQKLHRNYGERIISVRYESLVSGSTQSYCQLLGALGLDRSDETVTRVIHAATQRDKLAEKHSTSASADSSIGRWREDASPAELKLFAKYRRDIRTIGYEA